MDDKRPKWERKKMVQINGASLTDTRIAFCNMLAPLFRIMELFSCPIVKIPPKWQKTSTAYENGTSPDSQYSKKLMYVRILIRRHLHSVFFVTKGKKTQQLDSKALTNNPYFLTRTDIHKIIISSYKFSSLMKTRPTANIDYISFFFFGSVLYFFLLLLFFFLEKNS